MYVACPGCARRFIIENGNNNRPLPGLDAVQGRDLHKITTKVVKQVTLPSFTLALACCQQDAADKGLLLTSHPAVQGEGAVQHGKEEHQYQELVRIRTRIQLFLEAQQGNVSFDSSSDQ